MTRRRGVFIAVVALLTMGLGSSSAAEAPQRVANEPRISYPRWILAEKNGGIREIGDYRLPPADVPGAFAPTIRLFLRYLGAPLSFTQPYLEGCRAKYRFGLWLDFWSPGLPVGCAARLLQVGFVRSAGWTILVGRRGYRVGMSERRIPKGSKFIPDQGYVIASARRGASGVGSVSAKVKRGKISSFYLMFGYAGE